MLSLAPWLVVSHLEYAPRTLLKLKNGTDGQTPYRYITLTARCGQPNNSATDFG